MDHLPQNRSLQDSPAPLLTAGEVASYIGVSRNTIYSWIKTRGLPALKIGNSWKFRREEIDDWLDSTFSTGNAQEDHSWEEHWRPLVELTGDLLCLAGFDGYFKRLNPAWTKVLGWSEEELKRQPWLDFVHPDDLDTTLKTGEQLSQGHNVVQFENRYKCKDGSYRWLSWSSVPSRDKSLIFAVARDITHLKQVRMELQRTGKELSQILDSVPSLVFYKDTKNNFIRVNKAVADILDMPKEELEGASCFDIFPRDLAAKYWRDDLELLESGEPKLGILEPIETPSVKRWNLTDKIPYIDANGEQKGVIGISTDITQLKETEEELRLFENVIASSPDLISIVDKNFHYAYVNNAYTKNWDKQKAEIEGHHISELVGMESFETLIRKRLERAFAGERQEYSAWFTIPGKGERYFVTIYHPVETGDGEINHIVVNSRDGTARKLNEEELQLQRDRFAIASEAGGIGVWEFDINTGRLTWDEGMYNLYRVSENQFEGNYEAWRSRVHPEDQVEAEEALQAAIEKRRAFRQEFRIVVPGGATRYIKAAARIRSVEDSDIPTMIGINWDITDQKELEAEIRKLANTDPLTGAMNRRQFLLRGKEELARSKRHQTAIALLVIDLDHFKRINDSFGHEAGDLVLKQFVTTCEEQLRISDIVCRLGGEEFGILLPEAQEESALRTAERLRRAVEADKIDYNGSELRVTFSAGLTMARRQDSAIDTMISRADKALYRAKQSGRNRIFTS